MLHASPAWRGPAHARAPAMSDMKDPICLSSLSTLLSLPVLSSVVMASVAMLRFWSLISDSMSMLQLVTAMGCVMATCGGRARCGRLDL